MGTAALVIFLVLAVTWAVVSGYAIWKTTRKYQKK